jgi:hypothetical protein
VTLRLLDHQMNVQGKLCPAPASLDDQRAHRDGGDERPIHHIDVDPVRAGGFTGGQFTAQV